MTMIHFCVECPALGDGRLELQRSSTFPLLGGLPSPALLPKVVGLLLMLTGRLMSELSYRLLLANLV